LPKLKQLDGMGKQDLKNRQGIRADLAKWVRFVRLKQVHAYGWLYFYLTTLAVRDAISAARYHQCRLTKRPDEI
jgi:hypothetical protein